MLEMISKASCIILFAALSFDSVFCQNVVRSRADAYRKPLIDFTTIKEWSSVDGGIISGDGKYCCYQYYQGHDNNRIILQSTERKWNREFNSAEMPMFSGDSKFLAFKVADDSLFLYWIENDSLAFIGNVSNYTLSKIGTSDWLGYSAKGTVNELVLKNLNNGEERHIPAVISYSTFGNGTGFVIRTTETHDDKKSIGYKVLNLITNSDKTFWSTQDQNLNLAGYSFDADYKQIVYLIQKKVQLKNELWCYNFEVGSSFLVASDSILFESGQYKISSQKPEFDKKGKLIYFGIEPVETINKNNDGASVDIWSYNDIELLPIQQLKSKSQNSFTAIIDLQTRRFTRLEQKDEKIVGKSEEFVLVKHDLGNYGLFESNWNSAAQYSFCLVSLKDGTNKLLRDRIVNPHGNLAMSPNGKWILFFDFTSKNYFSYELSSGKIRNITKGCQTDWIDRDNDKPEVSLNWVPWRNTWLPNDEAVYIYDNYDIWLIDPGCKKNPVNITNGFGRRNNIKFELLLDRVDATQVSEILLRAVNKINKQRGFYSVKLPVEADPKLRSMGSYVYGGWDGNDSYNFPPDKAKDHNTYLVVRMSATEAPNYFVTEDFKEFKRITNVQPQEKVNWLKSELINWKGPDGKLFSGILYKPENFDAQIKYPIIFDYYEKRSDELNLYIYPKASESRINIPWFVSNGYLVFTPDIHYKMGEPGKSACDAVVSAAKYLSTFSWVDNKRMGLQGHSFGGYETNFIITHTNMFAAAISASGVCDLTSFYGSAARGGYPEYWAERNQGRIGGTIWQMPEKYINGSPIFRANKITTPLLMMNNKEDRAVPFAQGVEFFAALRRLGKRVWMLQYDGEGHSLDRGKPADDFHMRMLQFFDHYLKGKPAPKWMKIDRASKN